MGLNKKKSSYRRSLRQRLGIEKLENRELLAVFTVNVNTDNEPLNHGEGSGNIGDLRYAIFQASLNPGPDVIQFSLPENSTIRPRADEPSNLGPTAFGISDFGSANIDNHLTIDGSGSPGLTIDGQESMRLFSIGGGASTVTLKLKNLMIANGLSAGGDGGVGGVGGGGGLGLGGAIFVFSSGILQSEGVTFFNNVARGGKGGDGRSDTRTGFGVYSFSSDYSAGGGGGGIGSAGEAGSLYTSALRGGNGGGLHGGQGGNQNNGPNFETGAGGHGGFGSGGGGAGYDITYPLFTPATYNSTNGGNGGFGGGGGGGTSNGGTGGFGAGAGGSAANSSRLDLFGGKGGSGYGGAIYSEGGNVILANSTFYNNTAAGGAGGVTDGVSAQAGEGIGGAIFMRNGLLTSVFTTFTSNSAALANSIYVRSDTANVGFGAGSGFSSVNLINSLIGQKENRGFEFFAIAASGVSPVIVGSNNFITRYFGMPSNLAINTQGADPVIGVFSRTSGPTRIVAPRTGSPLFEAGNGVGPVGFADLTIDQTGVPRVGVPTIGAVENTAVPRHYLVNDSTDRLNVTNEFISDPFGTGYSGRKLTLRDALTAIITTQPSGSAPAGSDINTISFVSFLNNRTITLDPALTSIASDLDNHFGDTAFLLSSSQSVTIDATNTPGLTIDANNAKRIFSVSNDSELTIRNLTLTRGFADADDLVFTSVAASGMGGAVRVDSGGKFTAEKTLFVDNSARGFLGPALGGAIFSSDGTVNLTNSTFVGNVLGYTIISGEPNQSPFGMDVTSTVGGAVFMRNGVLNSNFVTFTNNFSASSGGDSIFVVSDSKSGNGYSSGTAVVNISHSILGQATIAGTDFGTLALDAASAPSISGSNNFIRNNPTSQGLPANALHPSSGQDPRLGALGNYGGHTHTVALLADSPLTTAAIALPANLATDQRGFVRPGGLATGQMFLGAFEPQASITALTAASSIYGNTTIDVTVSTNNPGLASSGTVALEYFDTGAWVLAGTSPLDANSQASFDLDFLPAGPREFRAQYISDNAWFANSSVQASFTISQAPAHVFYNMATESVQASGVRGEDLTSGLTLFYSLDGSNTFTQVPPTTTGYAIFYTLSADSNHLSVTSPTFLGNIAKVNAQHSHVMYDGLIHPGQVQAIGVNGQVVPLTLAYRRAFEDGSVQDPWIIDVGALLVPRNVGFYQVFFTRSNDDYLNLPIGLENLRYSGANLMIHDPNRVVDLAVTTLVDENDGTWFPAWGTGLSLREAMEYANVKPGTDTISFAAKLNGTMTLNGSRLPDAQSDLTVSGPGADLLTIDADSQSSILNVVGTNILVSGLSFTAGSATTAGAVLVANGASLTLDSSDFNNNIATGAVGVNADGGAILNRGTLTLRNSTLRDNSAVNGGGIYNATGAVLTVQNSTLAGNAATFGGGVYSLGTASFLNSTIAYNRSNVGGGIRATTSGAKATTTIINTILGGNTNFAGTAPQDFAGGGTFTAESTHNLIGPGGSGGLTDGVNGNIVVTTVAALGLGELSDNGGRTQTIATLAGSPAFNAGNNKRSGGLVFDQRGKGFPRVQGDIVDIGALEAPAAPHLVSVIVNGADTFLNSAQRSQVTSIVVTFDSPVTLSPGAFRIDNIGLVAAQSPVALAQSQIIVSGSGTTFTIRFGSGAGVDTRLLSFGLGRGNSLSDGNFLLTIDESKVTAVGGNTRLSPTNGFGDGDNQFGDNAVDNFFRMFGDSDGNGIVNSVDTSAFARAMTFYNAALDYDSDGAVRNSGIDRISFLNNFNKRRRTGF